MDGAGTGSYTPVQFCTSPPLDVYKPRKSQSPPPKLFHMSMNGQSAAGPSRQHSVDVTRVREGQRPSGAFRPRPRIIRPGGGVVEYTSLPARQEGVDIFTDEVVEDIIGEDSGHRSPNKRHRSTPKPQNIQRPCLDFEKMQQVIINHISWGKHKHPFQRKLLHKYLEHPVISSEFQQLIQN